MKDNYTIVSVVFTYPGRDPVVVPLDEAFQFADSSPLLWTPSRFNYANGSYTFAKGWWRDMGENTRMILCRIGAGAYGDQTILSR